MRKITYTNVDEYFLKRHLLTKRLYYTHLVEIISYNLFIIEGLIKLIKSKIKSIF